MSTLQAYLSARRMRVADLALAVGVDASYLSQIIHGRRPCSVLRAVAIEKATDGACMRWVWFPDDWHLIWPELIGAEGAPPVPQAEEASHA